MNFDCFFFGVLRIGGISCLPVINSPKPLPHGLPIKLIMPGQPLFIFKFLENGGPCFIGSVILGSGMDQ
jgi:hypothetical protein